MLGKCFSVICLVSVIFAVSSGNITALAPAALEGAADAVRLVISLAGMMTFWSGVLSVLEDCGAIKALSRIISPLMKIAFPNAWKTGVGKNEITASVSANILGLGNAATPLAISAISKMQEENEDKSRATNDMMTLAVLGSCSFSLFPTTIITMLVSGGAAKPFSVIVPVWICSAASAMLGILLCRLSGWRRND